MIRLRLFTLADPSRQIDQRMIGEDAVVIGRDAGADWAIHDPDRALSRRHCSVKAVKGGLAVRDLSANGTFAGDNDERIAANVDTVVSPGSTLRLGTFTLSVEALATEPSLRPEAEKPAPATPSLFAPPAGLDPVHPPSKPSRPDPFASQLVPDPLIADHRPTDRIALGDGDAWERRPAARAGDWEVPRERTDHENLIGTPREWPEPPRPERDAGFGFDAPFERPVLAPVTVGPADVAIPADWAEPAPGPVAVAPVVAPPPAPPEPAIASAAPVPPAPPPRSPRPQPTAPQPTAPPADAAANGDLFEAFCVGARLSPAAFAGEDRAAVMLRLGEVYRSMVLGLADLMSERTALKNEYRMSRTMVRPEANSPFKWAPPQRLAIEVLRSGDAGFTGGGAAVSDGFRDIKVHILCMLAGMRAAIETTMSALSPAVAEGALEGRSFLIKAQREAALWSEYTDRFERFRLDADDSADGPVNRAFRNAYEKQLNMLVGAETGYAGGRH
ncbi:MAG: type VI secretion system-associated FHA domain protein TagH [Janthinobacterium lividum]